MSDAETEFHSSQANNGLGYMMGFHVLSFLRNIEREVEYSDGASCPLASTSTSQDCTYIATCLRSYDTYLAFPEDPS